MNVEHINKQTKLLDNLHKIFIVISAVIAPLPTVLSSYVNIKARSVTILLPSISDGRIAPQTRFIFLYSSSTHGTWGRGPYSRHKFKSSSGPDLARGPDLGHAWFKITKAILILRGSLGKVPIFLIDGSACISLPVHLAPPIGILKTF